MPINDTIGTGDGVEWGGPIRQGWFDHSLLEPYLDSGSEGLLENGVEGRVPRINGVLGSEVDVMFYAFHTAQPALPFETIPHSKECLLEYRLPLLHPDSAQIKSMKEDVFSAIPFIPWEGSPNRSSPHGSVPKGPGVPFFQFGFGTTHVLKEEVAGVFFEEGNEVLIYS